MTVECVVSDITGTPLIEHTSGTSNPPVFTIEKIDSLENIELNEEQSITCKAISEPKFPNPENPDPPSTESPPGTTTVIPQNPCIDPAFVEINVLDPPLVDVEYHVGEGPYPVIPTHFDFTTTTRPRSQQHDLCGAIKVTPLYEGQPINNLDPSTPVTYNEAQNQFTVETDDSAFEETTKKYGLRAEFEKYPKDSFLGVTFREPKADIMFNDPCEMPTFNSVPQISPISGDFSGSGLDNQLQEFDIQPEGCKVEYECTDISPVDLAQTTGIPVCLPSMFDGIIDGNGTDGKFRFVPTEDDYKNGTYLPGEYIVEITGCTKVSQECKKAYFNIILADPCDPPTLEPPSDLIDQTYTLTDTSRADYITAGWTISPSYCKVEFSQNCTPLTNGGTAIQKRTETTISDIGEVTYKFDWTSDLSPLGQTQTCTITGRSTSIYGTNN